MKNKDILLRYALVYHIELLNRGDILRTKIGHKDHSGIVLTDR